MKRIIALLMALILLVTPVLSGCGSSSEEVRGISLVVILGFHANACRPTSEMLDKAGLTMLIENAIDYYKDSSKYWHAEANIKFILCDGNPEVVTLKLDGEAINMHYEAGNKAVLQEDMRYLANDILDALQSPTLKADDSEVDLLAALSMAGDLLREDPGVQNHIMVIDTGLNTEGALKMQNANVCASIESIGSSDDPDTTAAELVKNLGSGSIADLSNIYVNFYGLGNVDNVTQSIITDQTDKTSLIKFWTAYFDKTGATLVSDLNFTVNQNGTPMVHNSDGGNDTYLPVSSVPFTTSSYNGGGEGITILSFNENTLDFMPGSEKFRSKQKAIDEITSREAYFEQVDQIDPNAIYYVVGSIAKIDPNRTKEEGSLSLDRAREVAKLMVECCGISSDRIRLIPAGLTVLSWRNAVEFPNGEKTAETNANMQRNRVVAIVPSVCPDAMAELKGGNESKVDLLSLAVPYTN